MFDIDAGKLLIIGVIALVVLGPKELPRVLRQIGSILGKMRSMASEFQGQFAEAMRQSEMEELKKSVEKVADSARVDINYDPVAVADREIRAALEDKPSASPADPSASPSDAEAADADRQAVAQIIDAAAFGPGTTPPGPPAPRFGQDHAQDAAQDNAQGVASVSVPAPVTSDAAAPPAPRPAAREA